MLDCELVCLMVSVVMKSCIFIKLPVSFWHLITSPSEEVSGVVLMASLNYSWRRKQSRYNMRCYAKGETQDLLTQSLQ